MRESLSVLKVFPETFWSLNYRSVIAAPKGSGFKSDLEVVIQTRPLLYPDEDHVGFRKRLLGGLLYFVQKGLI